MTLFGLAATLTSAMLLAGSALAADQTILGKILVIKDPSPGGDPAKRSTVAVGKETDSPNTIVGDPTTIGTTLILIANGTHPSIQVFLLPQGLDANGEPFWRATKKGFKYRDAKGEQGPVKVVIFEKAATLTFIIKAVVLGKLGPLDVLPPNAGTDGFVVLDIAGGDRYCIQFGADGIVENHAAQLFKVKSVDAQGCPTILSTTTTSTSITTPTTTSSTTTTTLIGSPSGGFLD